MKGHKAKTAWGAPKADNFRKKDKPKSAGVEKRNVFSHLPTQSDLTTLELIRVQCYMSGYKLMSTTVGSGAYAKVYLAEVTSEKSIPGPDSTEVSLRQTNPMVAVKVIDKNIIPTSFLRKFIPRELENHRGLTPHPNVVRCFEHFSSGDHVFVIMEYCEGGDLLQFINRTVRVDRALKPDLIRSTFKKICLGLQHLHSENIVHRDLKCENILLTRDHDVKITDFGFSCRVEQKEDLLRTSCGSYTYAAPEVIASKLYNGFKADVWSLGIILFAMANGRLPFTERLVTEMNDQMKQQVLVFEDHVPPDCSVLLQKILQYDPDKRPTLDAILTDRWLTNKHKRSVSSRLTNRPKWVNSYTIEKDENSQALSELRVGNVGHCRGRENQKDVQKTPVPRKIIRPVDFKPNIRPDHRPTTVPDNGGRRLPKPPPPVVQKKPPMAQYLTVTEEREKLEQSKKRLSVAADPQSLRYVPKWFFQRMLQANDKLKTYYSKPKCRWVSSTKMAADGRQRQTTRNSAHAQSERDPVAPRSTPEPKLEARCDNEARYGRIAKGSTPSVRRPSRSPDRKLNREPAKSPSRSPTRAKSCMARLTEPNSRVPVIVVKPLNRPETRGPELYSSNSSPSWRGSPSPAPRGGHLHTRSSQLRAQLAKVKTGHYKCKEAAKLSISPDKAWQDDATTP